MKKALLILVLSVLVISSYAQSISMDLKNFTISKVYASEIKNKEGKQIKIIKDSLVKLTDEPTFVKAKGVEFSNGVIELDMLSLLNEPEAARGARGFIGLAFRINEDNSKFEGFYVRPTNARIDNQLRRNRTLQYFSYPDFKWDFLRKTATGVYESFADIGLNEWIHVKVEVMGDQAKFYINHTSYPSLIVTDLKHGKDLKGSVGLYVGEGTDGYFKNLKVTPK